jgi:hypothetical protein
MMPGLITSEAPTEQSLKPKGLRISCLTIHSTSSEWEAARVQKENIYSGDEMHESFKNKTAQHGALLAGRSTQCFPNKHHSDGQREEKGEKIKRQLHFKATVVLKLKTTRIARDIFVTQSKTENRGKDQTQLFLNLQKTRNRFLEA